MSVEVKEIEDRSMNDIRSSDPTMMRALKKVQLEELKAQEESK